MTRSATLCVRGGARLDPSNAVVPPLVQSTTYAWSSLDTPPPITYARSGNPTVEALERRLAILEDGASAICFSSGLAATDALFRSFSHGSRIVAGRHLYGGTTRLLTRIHGNVHEIEVVDTTQPSALETALARPADLVLLETPSNPTLRITDIRHAAEAAHAAGALLCVDNTFLTPLWQRPIDLGADVVLHSTTKYLEGHNATLGGGLVVASAHDASGQDPDGPLAARLRWIRKSTGATLAPFEAWLTLQGAKTLHLRTRQQWTNAAAVAGAAFNHGAVQATHFPGLPGHEGHAVHRRQATGDGGIVALDLGAFDAAKRFVAHLKCFTIAENLGATESLVTHPASMTHADLAPERRRADGIPDGLVRLSLGVEDTEDLVEDVERALASTPRLEVSA